MLVMPLAQLAECFLAIHQFATFGLRIAVFDLGGDIGAILGQPSFVFMQHLNRLSDEFIGGLVGAAFHVFLDQRFQLRLQMYRHTSKLPNPTCIQAP
jgi:hypothetical protein